MAPDTRNPCGEILLDEQPAYQPGPRIEEHTRLEVARLGIKSEDREGLFPGTMVVQRTTDLSFNSARCGTVISAVEAHVAILWGPWLPDPGPHADIVTGISHASRAIQALGRQCESTGKALSFFVKAQQAQHRKTRR